MLVLAEHNRLITIGLHVPDVIKQHNCAPPQPGVSAGGLLTAPSAQQSIKNLEFGSTIWFRFNDGRQESGESGAPECANLLRHPSSFTFFMP